MKIHIILWTCKNYIKSQQFFEGHEYLETLWIQQNERKNLEIKGCIQFFVSLELLKRKKKGSQNVFNRAICNVKNQKIKLLFIKIYDKYKKFYI